MICMRRLHGGRGLTLIEVLAALALLGLLTAALASWMQTTMRISVKASRELPWLSAADATLQRIGEDLLIGDFEPPGRDKSKTAPSRVLASTDRITVTTRAAGSPVSHEYALNRIRHQLLRRSGDAESVLLGEVGEFTCIDNDEQKVLTVKIASTTGLIRTRRFALP